MIGHGRGGLHIQSPRAYRPLQPSRSQFGLEAEHHGLGRFFERVSPPDCCILAHGIHPAEDVAQFSGSHLIWAASHGTALRVPPRSRLSVSTRPVSHAYRQKSMPGFTELTVRKSTDGAGQKKSPGGKPGQAARTARLTTLRQVTPFGLVVVLAPAPRIAGGAVFVHGDVVSGFAQFAGATPANFCMLVGTPAGANAVSAFPACRKLVHRDGFDSIGDSHCFGAASHGTALMVPPGSGLSVSTPPISQTSPKKSTPGFAELTVRKSTEGRSEGVTSRLGPGSRWAVRQRLGPARQGWPGPSSPGRQHARPG